MGENERTADSFRKTLRIGTRGSALAMWQARWVQERLRESHPEVEIGIHIIRTEGDRNQTASLAEIGGRGAFTSEIEHALAKERIDIAVHSLKDLPTSIPEGLALGAICEREDPRDVMVARAGVRALSEIPRGARIATGSLRRAVQLRHLRPDLEIIDIRGNVDTRLRKFDASDWGGLVLAGAGLRRLGLENRIGFVLEPREVLPAVGQGALGVEVRADDAVALRCVAAIDHVPTHLAVTAERAFLRRLGGGCRAPVAAFARLAGGRLVLDGLVATPDGTTRLRKSLDAAPQDAEALGTQLGESLLQHGAGDILKAAECP